jgi:hypothetical protein
MNSNNNNNTPNNFIVVYYKAKNTNGAEDVYHNFFVRTHDKSKTKRTVYKFDGLDTNGEPIVMIEQLFNRDTNEKVVRDEHFVFDNTKHVYKFEQCIDTSKRIVNEVPEEVKRFIINADTRIVVRYGKRYLFVTPNRCFGLDDENKLRVFEQ